jgi:hypothetical protein
MREGRTAVVYSLINAPTLIRDVARLPAGPALVADLLQAFALTPPDLEVLEARGRRVSPLDASRRAAIVRADSGRPRALAVLEATRSSADAHGLAAYLGSTDLLAAATIGGLDDLVRFVRHEVLTDAWSNGDDLAVASYPAALDVVTDGLVATYAGRADIGRAWRHWCAVHPTPSAAVAYPLIVDAVRQLDPAARVAAVPGEWAQLMHDACWAVHLTGRERTAAITQLSALRALFDVTKPAAPGHALVATVVAAVHACVVSDLLSPEVCDAMTKPFFSLLP